MWVIVVFLKWLRAPTAFVEDPSLFLAPIQDSSQLLVIPTPGVLTPLAYKDTSNNVHVLTYRQTHN